MAIETERKFLVSSDGWKAKAVGSVRLHDGLVTREGDKKIRVRIVDGSKATLAIKGQRVGRSRLEFEYDIPVSEAEEILARLCDGRVIEKVRHFVPHGGLTWEVDVYCGLLEGIVFAEVELAAPSQAVDLPGWVGDEITGDARWSKISLWRSKTLQSGGS